MGCPSFTSHVDVATDNLLDFEDSVHVTVETNGNIEEGQLDNHRPSETNNNNPNLVRPSVLHLLLGKYCPIDPDL